VSAAPTLVRTYGELARRHGLRSRVRTALRDAAVATLGTLRSEPKGSGWLRFPYYHHVFEDERAGFGRHLRWYRDRGDVVALDAAISLLDSPEPLPGRFFCLTFDDGFRSCATHAVSLLLDHGATAAFFLPTRYVGTTVEHDRDLLAGFHAAPGAIVEFLSWDECRDMASAGMTFGSHTVSHARMADLPEADVERELRASREVIERELSRECRHFCCPWGRPGVDFTPEREPAIAQRVGYRSFLTTQRGSLARRSSPLLVERDHVLAGWSDAQLRYFFAR